MINLNQQSNLLNTEVGIEVKDQYGSGEHLQDCLSSLLVCFLSCMSERLTSLLGEDAGAVEA